MNKYEPSPLGIEPRASTLGKLRLRYKRCIDKCLEITKVFCLLRSNAYLWL